jgi:hypothetical protein
LNLLGVAREGQNLRKLQYQNDKSLSRLGTVIKLDRTGTSFGPEYSSDNAGDGPVGKTIMKKNKEKANRMQNKESWYAMEVERLARLPKIQVREVDEWTRFIELMAGCRREEISPAMWEYARRCTEPARSIVTSIWFELSSGILSILALMAHGLKLMLSKEDEPREAEAEATEEAETEPSEADVTMTEVAGAEPRKVEAVVTEKVKVEPSETPQRVGCIAKELTYLGNSQRGAVSICEPSTEAPQRVYCIAKELIYLGKRYQNVPIIMSRGMHKIFIVTKGEKIAYPTSRLAYGEEGQDSWLMGDGLRLIVDQPAMRRLRSCDPITESRRPASEAAAASQLNRVGVRGESQRGAVSTSEPSTERCRPAESAAASQLNRVGVRGESQRGTFSTCEPSTEAVKEG